MATPTSSSRGLALARALAKWAQADRTYRNAAAERLRVGASDFDALLLLLQDEKPWTAGKIAEALGLTTGAVTGVLDRLEKANLVQRARDGVDRRQVLIQRAPSRREEMDAELAIQHAALAAAGEELDGASVDRAVRVIERAAEYLLARSQQAAEPAPPHDDRAASASLDGVSRGALRIVSGVANLELRAARIKDLFRAKFSGRAPVVRVEGGNVSLKTRGFGLFGWGGGDAEIVLCTAVPWTIDVRGGVSDLDAQLGELRLERIDVHGGASQVNVRLPPPSGTVVVRIVGGASKVTFRRPARTPVQIAITGGASGLRVDRKKLDAVSDSVRLSSEGYDGATDRYSIEITGGASAVTVTTD